MLGGESDGGDVIRLFAMSLSVALLGAMVGCGPVSSVDDPTIVPDGSPTTSAPLDSVIAIWELAPGQSLNERTRSITTVVTRLGCNSGVTGTVNEPTIVFTPTDAIIAFTVSPGPPDIAACQGNDHVAYEIALPEPLGDRSLIDGACEDSDASRTVFCETDERYTP